MFNWIKKKQKPEPEFVTFVLKYAPIPGSIIFLNGLLMVEGSGYAVAKFNNGQTVLVVRKTGILQAYWSMGGFETGEVVNV